MTTPGSRAPIAWTAVAAAALARLSLNLLSSGPLAYGYLSDELYYLDCANRLAWGYVDHPPLSIAALRITRATLGDSLLALHLVPALLGATTILLVALFARELGGGRIAQGLAGLATAMCPTYLGISGMYSMNAFDCAFWALAGLIVARIVNTERASLWLWLAVVLGLGLLNKLSMSWFGLGLGVGLALTPQRRWLATPWPWSAAAIAVALFFPHLSWQLRHDWPTLEFLRNLHAKMVAESPLAFVRDQFLIMHPAISPFWVAGLGYYFGTVEGRRHRIQAWIWVSVFLLLASAGGVRANYLGPAYAPLFAAGGVAFERFATRARWRWLPATAATVFVVGGLMLAPFAMPLLPPKQYIAYERALGVSAPHEETTDYGVMPPHYAPRFGWPEVVAAIEKAFMTLPPRDRARTVVLASSYGEAGAVNLLGAKLGLPRAISGHNSYWLWGPGKADTEVVLALTANGDWLKRSFREVNRVAEVDCDYCMPETERSGVYVCRGLKRPLADWWLEMKRYGVGPGP
jgi:4-amino-4-deoxy-L-arabinose transferase-like glycosyltransferase